MTTALIVGSGPAAAGAALALSSDPSVQVTVLDVGHRLDPDRRAVADRLASIDPGAWSPDDVAVIRRQPTDPGRRSLPQKWSLGSDYPFHDAGQLRGVRAADPDANPTVVSGAYGGLSNVWGAQVMPFTPATFDDWPVDFASMEPHYRSVLSELPFAAEDDALAVRFPLLAGADPLPTLAPRTAAVLAAAERHRADLARHGVTVGRARLAFRAGDCVRCGLCMTGCPYGLIYSSAQTFDRLRTRDSVAYHDGLLVVQVGQDGDRPFAVARDLQDGGLHRFEADRVYVACGAVGTTRLVLGSLALFDREVRLHESAQFVVAMASLRPTPDPRGKGEFTLNQFNMVVALDDAGHDVAQVHFYPHNPALEDALPAPVRAGPGRAFAGPILRRLTVGLGYLPSWESPAMRLRVSAPDHHGELPGIEVSGDRGSAAGSPMFRRVARRMARVAPALDLWPILPLSHLSGPGRSYHFGGTFPHRVAPADGVLTTDRQGRLRTWPDIHLVDASVFPTVPATTFTLTIMANAHRIARESLGGPS